MYYIVYGFLWLVSLLPLRVLYFFSDAVYALVFYVFKYRRDVVFANLKQAFPEKTDKERLRIAKKFYHNLIDTFIETIKLFSTGKKFIAKHCTADFSVFDKLYKEGKSCQLHAGHQFNWEWLNHYYCTNISQTIVGVYMPLANKTFEKVFFKLRCKYGTAMIPATDMKNAFLPWRYKQHILVLVADQNPGHTGNSYWFNFFGKPTPFIKGPERSAREKKSPVVIGFVKKIKRGYYHTEFMLITEDASTLPETVLTARYVDMLKEIITEQPEMWLWSHRRWKHEWKPEMGPVIG